MNCKMVDDWWGQRIWHNLGKEILGDEGSWWDTFHLDSSGQVLWTGEGRRTLSVAGEPLVVHDE